MDFFDDTMRRHRVDPARSIFITFDKLQVWPEVKFSKFQLYSVVDLVGWTQDIGAINYSSKLTRSNNYFGSTAVVTLGNVHAQTLAMSMHPRLNSCKVHARKLLSSRAVP
jgi:hypothetical protein